MNKPRTIYLDDDAWDKLRKRAFQEHLTISEVVRRDLTHWPLPTLAGLLPSLQPLAPQKPVSVAPTGVGMTQSERDAVLRRMTK